jgi:hypothetical protein
MRRSNRRRAAAIGGGACALLLAACSPAPPPVAEKASELETVEVSAAPDAAYSMAEDKVERRASENALAGALPDGFPKDIPIYRPSSLVDFTSKADGGALAVFATPADVTTVSSAMTQKLRAAGWQAGKPGSFTKAGRSLRLTVEPTPAGARFRLEF